MGRPEVDTVLCRAAVVCQELVAIVWVPDALFVFHPLAVLGCLFLVGGRVPKPASAFLHDPKKVMVQQLVKKYNPNIDVFSIFPTFYVECNVILNHFIS